MARLPVPNGDEGVWGDLINEFLLVSHHDDGTLRSVIRTTRVKDHSATGNDIQNDGESIQAALELGK